MFICIQHLSVQQSVFHLFITFNVVSLLAITLYINSAEKKMLIRNFFDDFLCMKSIQNEIGSRIWLSSLLTNGKRNLSCQQKKKQKAKNRVEEKHALNSLCSKFYIQICFKVIFWRFVWISFDEFTALHNNTLYLLSKHV